MAMFKTPIHAGITGKEITNQIEHYKIIKRTLKTQTVVDVMTKNDYIPLLRVTFDQSVLKFIVATTIVGFSVNSTKHAKPKT